MYIFALPSLPFLLDFGLEKYLNFHYIDLLDFLDLFIY